MKDNTGSMRVWSISSIGQTITIRHGQLGGSMQYKLETVQTGKATRTLDEQMMSRMASRISKQRDKGYRSNIDTAKGMDRPVNTLGMPKPMLAKKLRDVKDIDFTNAIAQPKLDGNRCLIYRSEIDGKNRAYSRNGKPMEAIDHILDDISIGDNTILDGELYCHGYPLQTIVSWVKRKQENSLKLKYHLYDIVMNWPYKERLEVLENTIHGDTVELVPSVSCNDISELMMHFREYREQGYEGAILRWGETGYEDGKRSKSLVKVKAWEDDEFFVIDIIPSKDGWGILVCDDKHGETFRVSAPGSMPEKYKILINKELYIGRDVTVEYANLTNDGVPFHPVAIGFRDEIQ